MFQNPKKILCPKCNGEISLDEALSRQLEEAVIEQLAEKQRLQEVEFLKKEKELTEKEKTLSELERTIEKKVAERTEQTRAFIEKEMRLKIAKEKEIEIESLSAELKEKSESLDKARKVEIDIRRERNKLEDDRRAFELEKQRQLDAEREKIRSDAQEKAEEELRLKILEKEKQLQDVMKANMELQRKLQQGSQQTQGEVLELELEELLRTSFQNDSINPVPKGITGADVIQKIYLSTGQECGVIAWESKHTKDWSDLWISKLKEDQRKINADIAVLVTEILPKNVKGFAYQDGIWITNHSSIFGLGTALRMSLIQAKTIKLASVGKNEKMEVLFNYLSGTEFRHKVEAIVEAFVCMKQDLDKEKRFMIKTWAKKEKQIEQVILNTSGMYGDMQGLLGSSIQPIPALEAGDAIIENAEQDDLKF